MRVPSVLILRCLKCALLLFFGSALLPSPARFAVIFIKRRAWKHFPSSTNLSPSFSSVRRFSTFCVFEHFLPENTLRCEQRYKLVHDIRKSSPSGLSESVRQLASVSGRGSGERQSERAPETVYRTNFSAYFKFRKFFCLRTNAVRASKKHAKYVQSFRFVHVCCAQAGPKDFLAIENCASGRL